MATAESGWLLHSWEAAAGVAPAARGAVLVAGAGRVSTLDAAVDLPLSELAALAAQVYLEQFQTTLVGLLSCDHCAEDLEVLVPLDQIARRGMEPDDAATTAHRNLTLASQQMVQVRVPTTRDLVAVQNHDNAEAALLARCVTAADRADLPVAVTDTDRALIEHEIEQLAGAAALTVRAQCPECGAKLSAPVDVASLLWERVKQDAPSELAAVADLAAAFGWAEADILAMTARRRDAYLAMARGVET